MPEKVNPVRQKERLAHSREEASLEKSTKSAAVKHIPRKPSTELVSQIRSMRYEPYEYLAALSCWHLLWSAGREETAARRQVFETGDERQGRPLLNPQAAAPWHEWTKLLGRDRKGFQRAVERITLDLRKRFERDGNLLAVVGQALHSLNRPVLRWALERISNTPGFANNDSDFSSSFPKVWREVETAVADEQGNWVRKHGYRRTPIVHDPVGLVRIVADVLKIRRDELFYMPDAQDGFAAAEIYERAALGADHSPTVITVNDPHYGVVAASRFKHVWDRNRLRVHVSSSWDACAPAPGADVVFCDKLADVEFGSLDPTIDRFPVPVYDSALLQIQQALLSLRPGGRAAIVVPRTFAFGRGEALRVREWLLANYRLDAVVELERGISGPDVGIANILLFVRRLPPVESVLFLTFNLLDAEFCDRIEYSPSEGILTTVLQARLNTESPAAIENQINEWESDEELSASNSRLLTLAKYLHLGGGETNPSFPELVPVADLLRRDAELLWKENRGSLELLLDDFARTRAGVRVARLDDVVKLLGGVTPVADTYIEPVPVRRITRDIIGLVRVSDFPRFVAGEDTVRSLRKVGRHILKLAPIDEMRKLRPKDVLLSVNGTVGRVCLFDQELTYPSIASNGLAIVRAPDATTSLFLAKLFTSEPYQRWFSGEATGSTIQHLKLTRLRNLPVPLLPASELCAVIEELKTGATEARLRTVFTRERIYSNLASLLLESTPVNIFAYLSPEDFDRSRGREALKSACDEMAGWQRLATREENTPPALDVLYRLGIGLLDALELPETSDRYAVLQEWRASALHRERDIRRVRNELMHSINPVDTTRHIEEARIAQLAERFVANLLRLAQIVMQRQLGDLRLTATVTPTILTIGKLAELQFTITNGGSLPVRKFSATSTPFNSVTTTPVLSASGIHRWTLAFTPLEVRRHTVCVAWNAHRLDEEPVSGTIELAIEVESLRGAALSADFGENPYVYARVLDGEDDRMFYGRAKVLDGLATTLSRHGSTTIQLIEGNRRIGKTSLLRHFVRHKLPDGWLPVFINFQDFEGDPGQPVRAGIPTRAIFTGMARELIRAVGTVVPGVDIPDLGIAPPATQIAFARYLNRVGTLISADEPFASFRMLVETLRGAVHPRRLLLMFDEFDRVQEGIESGITSDQVPENIRHLFQTYNDLAGFFTGSRTIRRLRMEYWNVLFGMGEPLKLTGLEEDEARQLIERPVAGRLVFTNEAVQLITTLTARQPLLIQALCLRLFDVCKFEGERSVSASLVERVAEEKVADNEHFETLWSHISSDRQRLLVFLVNAMEARDGDVSFDRLLDEAEKAGVAFTQRSLKDALTDLLDLEVLRVSPQPTHARYSLEVPLFARWLRRNKDFAETRVAAQEED